MPGWYCADCGLVQSLTPYEVRCRRCDVLGLYGFNNNRPFRVQCPVDGCVGRVWDDGGVHDAVVQHGWWH